MGAPSTDLLIELKVLRKGRGLYAPKIDAQVGPALRTLCGIDGDDDAAVMRQKLVDRLSEFAQTLPPDLELAVTAALALHPDAHQLFLNERIRWLADRLGRDDRTARRRVDEGLDRLAEAAAAGRGRVSPERPAGGGSMQEGWYVDECHALLRLDRPSPEAIERRVIVADRDGIDEIVAAITLPRHPAGRRGSHDLIVEVLYGATLVRKEHDTPSRFRFVLSLPTTLRAGERHEYMLVLRVPPDQPMRSHYVFTSPRRCDLFDLRIRFDPDRMPEDIWKVNGAFHRDIDDEEPVGDRLHPDSACEVHVQFRDLSPGFGYGAQWKNPGSYELQHLGPGLPRTVG
ncbi:MAG TPA: hypothetical protein VLJ59_15090 [Mycobacteriales bacterium]|nr:hypothetical protein [Mycobacteriales bacterium]